MKDSRIDLKVPGSLAEYDGNKVTYAGGIRSLEDVETINEASDGKIDFTIGSALDIFGGNLKFEEVAVYN